MRLIASKNKLISVLSCLLAFCVMAGSYVGNARGDDLTSFPQMGITVTAIIEDALNKGQIPQGAYVVEIDGGSPAAAAGIQLFDIIIQANDELVLSTEDLTNVVVSLQNNDTIDLTIYRTGVDLTKAVEVPRGKYVNISLTLGIVDESTVSDSIDDENSDTEIKTIANTDAETAIVQASSPAENPKERYDLDAIKARYVELEANNPSEELSVYIKNSAAIETKSSEELNEKNFLCDLATGLENRWRLSINAPSDMNDEQIKRAYSKMVDAELTQIEKYWEVQLSDPLLDFFAHGYIQALRNQRDAITNYYGTLKYDKLWTTDGYDVRALLIYLINRCYQISIDEKYQSTMGDFVVTGYLSLPHDPVKEIANFLSRYSSSSNEESKVTPAPTATPAPTRTLNLSGFSTLSANMKGEEVRRLQEKLVSLGYLTKASGTYDRNTIKAVHKFQQYNLLPVSDDASAKMQAILFSYSAEEIKIPDVEILDVGLATRYSSLVLRPTIMNNTDSKITSIRLRIKAYNYSGQRVINNVLDINDIQRHKDSSNYNMEYSTLEANGLNINPHKKMQLNGKKSFSLYSFSSSMVNSAFVAVIGYQTSSGLTVAIPENEQLWYGTDGNVKKWTYENAETKPPHLTKEIDASANSYNLGIYYSFVDNFFAEVINAPMGGAYITSFDYNSPLQYEGIVEGDIIFKIGDVWVTDEETLLTAKGLAETGKPTRIQFVHRGELNEIELTLR